jgi:hypothetical protein
VEDATRGDFHGHEDVKDAEIDGDHRQEIASHDGAGVIPNES